ncbi:MAG: hypothetical protein JJT96_04190 [Opitutales bacterium]|nr:hypothetical protein [Opitutales bacterium]
MPIWEAILFGLVQGLTEFLPISSTAHIVIFGYIVGRTTPGLGFEIFLHMASLLAVLLYFRQDLYWVIGGFFRWVLGRGTGDDAVAGRFAIYLGVGTIITGGLGLIMMKVLGDTIKAPPVVATALIGTAIALLLVERLQRLDGRGMSQLGLLDAILVGLAQTVAVLPGVSRSGATLIAGLALGLNRDTAVRFSFLLAIPVLAGSSVLALKDISGGEFAAIGLPALIVSFIVSFIASWVSILWLIGFLKQRRLYWFSIYLVALAIFVFIAFPSGQAF